MQNDCVRIFYLSRGAEKNINFNIISYMRARLEWWIWYEGKLEWRMVPWWVIGNWTKKSVKRNKCPVWWGMVGFGREFWNNLVAWDSCLWSCKKFLSVGLLITFVFSNGCNSNHSALIWLVTGWMSQPKLFQEPLFTRIGSVPKSDFIRSSFI